MGVFIHGHALKPTFSPEYRAYYAMKNRVLNKKQDRYRDYGGRGIKICDKWLFGEYKKTGFECFLADVGCRPSKKHSIDRVDNDGDYEPANVRWATPAEQSRNSRNNRIVDFGGYTGCLLDVSDRYGAVSYNTTCMRLHRGWSLEDAVSTALKSAPVAAVVPF